MLNINSTIQLNIYQNYDLEFKKLFIEIKYKALKCLNLYCAEYFTELKPHFNELLISVINLTNNEISDDKEYSELNIIVLEFYKILFERKRICLLPEDFIATFLCKTIYQNLKLSEKEINDFTENPDNFIVKELEEPDVETSNFLFKLNSDITLAIQLVKELIKNISDMKDKYVNPFISDLLNHFNDNPQNNYMSKIIVINFLFATLIKIKSRESKILYILNQR